MKNNAAMLSCWFSLFISGVAVADRIPSTNDYDVQDLTEQVSTIQHLLQEFNGHSSSRQHQRSLEQIDREIDALITSATRLKQRLNSDHHPHVRNHRAAYTSEPVRGSRERRTRVIRNPFPHRYVTGITLTGLDDDYVHVRDLIAYPYKRPLSHQGFSLSNHHPEQYIPVQGYLLDYISIAAKKKNYFTATFHYD